MPMKISAHRCGTDRYPQLTVQAAEYSLGLGAASVEMDIRFTKDNVAIISHDADAGALFGVEKNISDMTLAEFKQLQHRSNPVMHPHTLEEVLTSGVAPILFHIKESEIRLGAILNEITRYGYLDKVIMGHMSVGDVQAVKKYYPEIQVLAFMHQIQETDDYIAAGADIIRYWETWVDEDAVKRIHDKGCEFWVMAGEPFEGSSGYTSEENLLYWQSIGVDAVILNEVETALEILKQ